GASTAKVVGQTPHERGSDSDADQGKRVYPVHGGDTEASDVRVGQYGNGGSQRHDVVALEDHDEEAEGGNPAAKFLRPGAAKRRSQGGSLRFPPTKWR